MKNKWYNSYYRFGDIVESKELHINTILAQAGIKVQMKRQGALGHRFIFQRPISIQSLSKIYWTTYARTKTQLALRQKKSLRLY